MNVRHYTFDSRGLLTGYYDAESDRPVTEQDVTLPAGVTLIPPPDFVPGMVRVFDPQARVWSQAPAEEYPVGAPPEDLLTPRWNGAFWAEGASLEEFREAKRQEIARCRYEAETGGIVLDGFRVATDDRSQAKIAGAALKAMQDPSYSCWWKGESGWALLDASTILAIADAVRAHVQACFDRERSLASLVDSASTVEAVKAVSWEG